MREQMPLDSVAENLSALQRTLRWDCWAPAMPSQVWRLDLQSASQPAWLLKWILLSATQTPPPLMALGPPPGPRVLPSGLWERAAISKQRFPASPFCALSARSLVVSISPYWKTF